MARIYEGHVDGLVTVARHLLGEPHLAEDVVHDVFVGFAQNLGAFRLTGSLRSFLTTCVVNRCRDQWRRAQRNRTTDLSGDCPPLDPGKGPSSTAIDNEQSALLHRAILQLPHSLREVVTLRLHGQMTFRAIAELQQVSVNTAKSRYRYALEGLCSALNSGSSRATATRN
jgi:RNA polymerase sigma-70 factor (ECF subfamily)